MMDLNLSVDNIDDEHNMSTANSNNLEVSNTILGKQSAKKSIHKRFRSKSMDFRVDEKKLYQICDPKVIFKPDAKPFKLGADQISALKLPCFKLLKKTLDMRRKAYITLKKSIRLYEELEYSKFANPSIPHTNQFYMSFKVSSQGENTVAI